MNNTSMNRISNIIIPETRNKRRNERKRLMEQERLSKTQETRNKHMWGSLVVYFEAALNYNNLVFLFLFYVLQCAF